MATSHAGLKAGKRTAAVACALALACGGSSWAADLAAGKAKAGQCAVCHGPRGIATLPDAPNLAGQNEIYLAKALRDFKSGARKNEMMNMMADGLSEQDIDNLAAYYQSIEIVLKEEMPQ